MPGGYVGRPCRGASRRLPEPDRLDHPDPDPALSRDHPLDAVLARPPVRRARPDRCAIAGPPFSRAHRARREEKRRDQERQEVLKKHLDKAPAQAKADPQDRGQTEDRSPARHAGAGTDAAAASRGRAAADEPNPEAVARKTSRTAAMVEARCSRAQGRLRQTGADAGHDQAPGAAGGSIAAVVRSREVTGRTEEGRVYHSPACVARCASQRKRRSTSAS